MDYVKQSGRFSKEFQGFTGKILHFSDHSLLRCRFLVMHSTVTSLTLNLPASDGPLGKRMNNSKTRTALGWEPKFTSFAEFLGLTE